MSPLRGSAVKLKSEIDDPTGVTMTLEKIIGPLGDTIVGSENVSMTFDSVDTKSASVVWQSTFSQHIKGRYSFITRAVSGANTDRSRGRFRLEDD